MHLARRATWSGLGIALGQEICVTAYIPAIGH